MENKPDLYVYPKEHPILAIRDNYGRDFSEDLRDADDRLVYESGLYCYQCDRVYGLNKLELISEPSIIAWTDPIQS